MLRMESAPNVPPWSSMFNEMPAFESLAFRSSKLTYLPLISAMVDLLRIRKVFDLQTQSANQILVAAVFTICIHPRIHFQQHQVGVAFLPGLLQPEKHPVWIMQTQIDFRHVGRSERSGRPSTLKVCSDRARLVNCPRHC